MSSIESVRQKIDALDTELLSMLNKRIDLAKEIGEIKVKQDGEQALIYRPEREAQVLRRLKSENSGHLQDEQIDVLFREVMSISRGAEARLSVAVLGPEGTFSEMAGKKQFGSSVNIIGLSRIEEVFTAVENGTANYGVVPVENSTEGGISATADSLVNSNCKISGEVYLPIHQFLLSNAGSLDAITTVYSHGQSLAQCRNWLLQKLPHVEVVSVGSNAVAAKMAAEAPDTAAIAGEIAAVQYQLNILARNIEDESDNTTRFLVISKEGVLSSGNDKTSLLISCTNRPGGLFALLKPLNDHNISMLRIESRPAKSKRWDYLFFVDIEGHQLDENMSNALDALLKEADLFRVLGSYPRAD
ncbi:MAG: chorismate mutase/prephenate dehydratase [Saprospiraceae bacterium]|jgi:chorismate mutase/prephenate dehydratase